MDNTTLVAWIDLQKAVYTRLNQFDIELTINKYISDDKVERRFSLSVVNNDSFLDFSIDDEFSLLITAETVGLAEDWLLELHQMKEANKPRTPTMADMED